MVARQKKLAVISIHIPPLIFTYFPTHLVHIWTIFTSLTYAFYHRQLLFIMFVENCKTTNFSDHERTGYFMAKLNWTMAEKNDFVRDNEKLIHEVAHGFPNTMHSYEDIFQIACVGLTKAFSSYDDEKGTKFTTYAMTCMTNEVRGVLRRDAAKCRSGNQLVSYDAAPTNKDGKDMGNYLGILPTDEGFEDRVADIILCESVREVMQETLSPSQCTALDMVADGYSYADIAHLLSIPVESIRKLIRSARYRLRNNPKIHH